MTKKSTFALPLILSLNLVACGGGGDSPTAVTASYLALAEILEATVWEYTSPPSFPTMEERGTNSMRSLLNTVYHLSGAMYDGADVGFGAYMKTTMITATTWREEYRFGSLNGYQYANQRITLGTGNVATYPCQGSSNIPPAFEPANESPNPFGNTVYASALVGPPIYLKVDAPQVLTVNAVSSSVTQNGITVPFWVLSNSNDPNMDPLDGKPYIGTNEVFVIPTIALSPNTSYQVTLNGTINNVAFNRSFTMTTGL